MAEIAAIPSQHDVPCPGAPSRAAQVALWLPGLLVAAGAIAATAHGLYEVAIAAQVLPAIAWLYAVITDGLALVAYGAATRMQGRARRYSWAVVATAAGLSGLAQAAYLAGDATVAAPAALRFGVGAWPAIAAAIVAHLLHLLHLLATAPRPPQVLTVDAPTANVPYCPSPSGRTPDVQSDRASSDVPLENDVRRSQGFTAPFSHPGRLAVRSSEWSATDSASSESSFSGCPGQGSGHGQPQISTPAVTGPSRPSPNSRTRLKFHKAQQAKYSRRCARKLALPDLDAAAPSARRRPLFQAQRRLPAATPNTAAAR